MQRFLILQAFLWVAQLAVAARAWEYVAQGVYSSSVVVNEAGDLFSGGFQYDDAGDVRAVLVKHSAANGTPEWTYVLREGGPRYQLSVALTRGMAESVLVASSQRQRYREWFGAVAKVSSQGAQVWRFEPAEYIGFRATAEDPNGDVIAAGAISDFEPEDHDLIVMKLSAETGSEIWRRVIPGNHDNVFDRVSSVLVDLQGDVVLSGSISDQFAGQQDFFVAKLSGSTGELLWQHEIVASSAHGGEALDLALQTNGDVIAAGRAVLVNWCDFLVVRLSGADGSERWRTLTGGGGCDGANAVAVDENDDVFATGNLDNGFSVVKYSGVSGSILWRHDVPHVGTCGGGGCGGGNDLAIADEHVIAAGGIQGAGNQGDLAVAKISTNDGSRGWLQLIDYASCGDSAQGLAVSSGAIGIAGLSYELVEGECAWPYGALYAVRKLGLDTGKSYWAGCSDEIDNDGDGDIDFPLDQGCRTATWPSETADCEDGLDNDGDGAIDLADLGCDVGWRRTESPECQDGIDNDGVGGTDFDGGASVRGAGNVDPAGPDAHCEGRPWRSSELPGCGLGFEVLLPIILAQRCWRSSSRRNASTGSQC